MNEVAEPSTTPPTNVTPAAERPVSMAVDACTVSRGAGNGSGGTRRNAPFCGENACLEKGGGAQGRWCCSRRETVFFFFGEIACGTRI